MFNEPTPARQPAERRAFLEAQLLIGEARDALHAAGLSEVPGKRRSAIRPHDERNAADEAWSADIRTERFARATACSNLAAAILTAAGLGIDVTSGVDLDRYTQTTTTTTGRRE